MTDLVHGLVFNDKRHRGQVTGACAMVVEALGRGNGICPFAFSEWRQLEYDPGPAVTAMLERHLAGKHGIGKPNIVDTTNEKQEEA